MRYFLHGPFIFVPGGSPILRGVGVLYKHTVVSGGLWFVSRSLSVKARGRSPRIDLGGGVRVGRRGGL